MHRPPRNRVVRLASISLPRGWELNLIIIIKVEVGIGEKEIEIIIIKEFIMGICTLKPNLFGLVACVSHHRVYK